MSEANELKAVVRERVGKGAARAARREGLVPAVIYGNKQAPEAISIEQRIIVKQLNTGSFLSTIYTIEVDGKKTRVLPRDIQVDPVKDFPIHVDFLRVSKESKIAVEVSVRFINEEKSPGLKRGAVLNVVRHEVELLCPVDAIPDEIVVDLDGSQIGDTIHVSSVKLPDNVTPTITDRDFTIATIAGKGGAQETDDDEEEGEGGEE
ncbi:MAG: 50S ribosomal protein L25/general stress protein Ctc [Methyloligellaceae bacterium]